MSSEPLSEQHGTRGFSRWETNRFAGSLRRLGTFWVPKHRDGEDGHPIVAGLAEREEEEERSPGLPWIQLEALFGRNVQDLGLETVAAEGDSDSPPAMKWSRGNIRRLIDAFGRRALEDTNEHGINLVHLTLMGRQLKCAKLLFNYAADQQVYVSLRWRGGDILKWSLDYNSRRLAEFVLQKMTDQRSSPKETAECLRDQFGRLVKQFPRVMQKYILNDKFCFEYGRFDVPQSLFADRPDAPIAVLDAAPSSWKPAEGSDGIKDFWKQKGISDFIDLDSTSDIKIPAATKFLCVDLSNTEDQQTVVKSLLSANYPADVFKTQSIKNFVQWRWILRVRVDAIVILVFDLLSTTLFYIFVAVAWDGGPHYSDSEKQLARSALVAALGAKRLPIAAGRLEGILHVGVMLCLLIVLDDGETTTKHFCFAASLQCVLCMFALTEDLKPFNLTGPFISMIGYVMADIRPFILLGTLMVITFGATFRVLFAYRKDGDRDEGGDEDGDEDGDGDEDEGQRFRTLWLSFESMFHASLGNFDPEALHESSGSFYYSLWRSLLFNLFLFLASIVLLSLLVAVLGDTCDRVILSKEAESIKSRATCLTRKALKEYKKIRVARTATGLFRRIMHTAFDWLRKIAGVFFQIVLWLLFLILVIVSGGSVSVRFAIIVAVVVSEVIASLLRKEGTCLERRIAPDPFLRRLNSNHVGSGVSVFWFLVPVTSTQDSNSFWEGRLIAMSKLVSDRMKKNEESQQRDAAKVEASFDEQAQRTQEIQDRLARIEGFLQQMAHATPQSSKK